MKHLDVRSVAAEEVVTDLLVIPCVVTAKLQGVALEIDRVLGGKLSTQLVEDGFTGKIGESFVFPSFGATKAKKIAIIGIGEKKKVTADALRLVAAKSVKLAESSKSASMVFAMPSLDLDPKIAGAVVAEGLVLSAYRFHVYHGTLRKHDVPKKELESVTIVPDGRAMKSVMEGVVRGRAIATATCSARNLVNTPSSHMAPKDLSLVAQELQGRGVAVKIMDKREMERLGMGAALAVAQGSAHAPVAVHMVYKPRGAKKRVAIIGKAVTFDSGGLSIKPADAMMTMKCDMAGAAAVIGLFKLLPELKVNVEVHGIFLAVENMPGGAAYRPGDVIKAMDGTTIEVLNTDAEGRLTLADALCYAKTIDPDLMIDLATLTGACMVGLGEEIAAVIANDRRLSAKLLAAAELAGEVLWELPLYEPYKDLLKSKVADMKNIGNRFGGAITAALFMKPFVGETPWAHLDIAGPAFIERETRPDLPYGGSGYGVRTLAKFLEKL